MKVAAKLAGFAVVAVIVFGSAWGLGAAIGPIDNPAPSTTTTTTTHEGPTPPNEHNVHRAVAVTAGTIDIQVTSTGRGGGS